MRWLNLIALGCQCLLIVATIWMAVATGLAAPTYSPTEPFATSAPFAMFFFGGAAVIEWNALRRGWQSFRQSPNHPLQLTSDAQD